MVRKVLAYSLSGLLLASASNIWAAHDCGSLQYHYGPFDYTNPEDIKNRLPVVERFHFGSGVESLKKGINNELWQDLDYTLRVFPNHHRALNAMARYQLKHIRQAGQDYLSAECYFDRAIQLSPADGIVRMIYGIYLHNKGRLNDALQRYKEAEALQPDSAEVLYNLGLLFVDMKDLTSAYNYAKRAYAKGYPLPGLRNRLKRQGIWMESKIGD